VKEYLLYLRVSLDRNEETFKDLDEDFGNIELLKARQNDLLVLQEDKISYVLVNKNTRKSSISFRRIWY